MSRRGANDELYWLNMPVCLQWREEAGEKPGLFRRLSALRRDRSRASSRVRDSDPRGERRALTRADAAPDWREAAGPRDGA
jgi:hypothetical protein